MICYPCRTHEHDPLGKRVSCEDLPCNHMHLPVPACLSRHALMRNSSSHLCRMLVSLLQHGSHSLIFFLPPF